MASAPLGPRSGWPTLAPWSRPLLGAVHICDDDGQELPPGQTGTIYKFSDGGTFEYHNDPDKTADSQHPSQRGWTTLGDMGYLDDDGFLFLTDRKTFMIISGGVNIYPQRWRTSSLPTRGWPTLPYSACPTRSSGKR